MYSERTLALSTVLTAIAAVSVGFVAGFLLAKRKDRLGKIKMSSHASGSSSDIFDRAAFQKAPCESGFATPPSRVATPPSSAASPVNTPVGTPSVTPTSSLSTNSSVLSQRSDHLLRHTDTLRSNTSYNHNQANGSLMCSALSVSSLQMPKRVYL